MVDILKRTLTFSLLAALILCACQKEGADIVSSDLLTFTATIDGAETRTSLDGTKIVWNAGEEINIFYGASEGSRFVSTNTEPSQMVTFTGTLSAFTGTTGDGEPNSFWAIYPYSATNSSSGSGITAYLPGNQRGIPNNIPDKALMMVAKAPGLALSFKQVCARLRVIVDTPDIERIEISGNADETVAGSISVSMNSQGVPEWQAAATGGEKVIELTPASGTTFAAGETDYYVALLPQEFSSGFTMTCYKDGEHGSYSTGAVTFERNQVRSVRTSRVTEWTVEQPNNVIYYTSSDGDVVVPYNPDAFGVNIVSNEYVDGRGVITFDGDLTSIGSPAAFLGCTRLTSVAIPESVTSIGYTAFQGCSGFTGSLVLPEALTSIGGDAFQGCYGLTGSLVLPEGLTSIGDSAFRGCYGFTGSLVLPEGLTSIGNHSFYDCYRLTDIKVLPMTPPTGGSRMFDSTNDIPIYVPAGSVEAYKSAEYWSNYADRIQAITE